LREHAATSSFAGQVRERRNTAILLFGHLGAFRESELVALDTTDITLDEEGLVFLVRTSKTDQQAVGMVKAINRRRDVHTCAPCAWIRWQELLTAHHKGGNTEVLKVLRAGRGPVLEHVCHDNPQPTVEASSAPGSSAASSGTALDLEGGAGPVDADIDGGGQSPVGVPVFRPITQAGWLTDTRLHREQIRWTIRSVARHAGLTDPAVARLGGHSLRAGFVTDAFAAGARPDEIMRQTGHTHPATVEIYRRDRPLIGNAVLRLPDK